METMNKALLYDLRTQRITSDLDCITKLVQDYKRVLEVGSGTGRILRHLAKVNGAKYAGIEIDPQMYEVAQRNCGDYKNIELMNIDFLLYKDDDKYDCILFPFNMLAEFMDVSSRLQALKKAKEILRPEGRIIIINNPCDMSTKKAEYRFDIGNSKLGRWQCTITCLRDFFLQISNCQVKYSCLDGEYMEIVDAYCSALLTRNELLTLYIASNLIVIEEYGDYKLGPINSNSDVHIQVLATSIK